MRDSFVDNWWTAAVDKGDVNCTDQELEMFLDKAISFRGYPLPENYTSITDAGIVRTLLYTILVYGIFIARYSYTCMVNACVLNGG